MPALLSGCCVCGDSSLSSDTNLLLCEPCLCQVEALEGEGDSYFRASYACPALLLEAAGSLKLLLEKLLIPPSETATVVTISAQEALHHLQSADAGHWPLLVLTGAGTSVSYGVGVGYGTKEVVDGESVNARYWSVYVEARRILGSLPAKNSSDDFYARLSRFIAAKESLALVCAATSNIDGLCSTRLGVRCSLLELHGSVMRLQCSRREGKDCMEALHAASNEPMPHGRASSVPNDDPFGFCNDCGGSMRFNVTTFGDWPRDIVGTQKAQTALCHWVTAQETSPAMQILCLGCSDHLHSMVHEARAVRHRRSQLGLATHIICVNPDPAGAAAVGDCSQVTCGAEAFFPDTAV